ncbi:DUF6069 family protein [Natronococcus jeotgali]|uniref:Uncharacterized protein n=1 Tax=Natronococcus jeotgali DSM 18795 TaxID=1227498 RepID=L9X2I0_9EURY|nr:DUF6069 family protein [Natronococcus jeotgali]ELY54798.1 hypothetical protein C492_16306 [Natronococcus jeotgali DSM 18795]
MASESSRAETGTTARTAGRLVRAGAVALALSLAVNWAVTFGAIAAGVAPALDAMSYEPVTFLTTVGVVGATLTYGALARVARNPDRAFAAVAAVVLLLSLIPDFTVVPSQPGGSLLAGAVLGVMHVTTAAICVWALTDVGR